MYALRGLDYNGVLLYLLFNVYMSALHNQDGDNRISIDEFVGYFSDRVNTGEWPGQACCPDVCMYSMVWWDEFRRATAKTVPMVTCCANLIFTFNHAMRCGVSAVLEGRKRKARADEITSRFKELMLAAESKVRHALHTYIQYIHEEKDPCVLTHKT